MTTIDLLTADRHDLVSQKHALGNFPSPFLQNNHR